MLFPKYSGIFIALFFPATHQKRQRGWRPDYFQKWAARLPCRCRRRSIQIRPLRPLFATLPRPDDSPVIHVLSNRTRTFHSLPMRPEPTLSTPLFCVNRSVACSNTSGQPSASPKNQSQPLACRSLPGWNGQPARYGRQLADRQSPATCIIPHQHRSPSPFFNL